MITVPTPIVVVPDGLAADEQGRALNRPSFVFRAVLDVIVERYRDNQVFVAPANDFNGPATEEEAGQEYLLARGCKQVLIPPRCASSRPKYIDTLGNARLLRSWLEEQGRWPIGPCILASACLHARRAARCFNAEGFEIADMEKVAYAQVDEPIVSRLFYYRYPRLHWLYEVLAMARDSIRIAFDSRGRQ